MNVFPDRDELVLLPCSGDPRQIGLLADALDQTRRKPAKEATP
ncbi:hypothetical protein [Actinomadura sp. WMMB 499]|nr:hypothetical protein [Actinomadura sp. WMMB 499]